MKCRILLSLALMLLSPAVVSARPGFSDGKTGFAVKVAGEVVPYRVMALAVLPAEQLELEIVKPRLDMDYLLFTPGGGEKPSPSTSWSWQAPAETGLYPLRVRRAGSSDEIVLHVFVIVPMAQVRNQRLNDYRIGSYPAKPLRGLEVYKPPPGLIQVTRENADTPVSPHFRLNQFLCKQDGGYPKYVVLRPRLLLKLELLLQEVNAAGYRADTFHVMSGYRTPDYNAAIGNVKYSRHMWGDAVDIFIDEAPRDGMMDDLNSDGRIDQRDAAMLYDLVEDLRGKPYYAPFIGGLGRYGKTAQHGPFIHVDVRGFRARWGI